jgi:putative ABC transport system permease protein
MESNGGWKRVSLYLAVRSIYRGNRSTLFLTILIIALVMVLMNFLGIIIGGVITLYNDQMIDYQYGHVILEPRDKAISIQNADELVKRLKGIPGVKGVTAHVSTGITITNPNNGKFQSISLMSFDPDDEQQVTSYQDVIVDGDYLSKGDTDEILLGTLLAGKEDESQDKLPSLGGVKVGDRVMVTFSNGVVKSYRVKGIYETLGALIDHSAFITRGEMDSVIHSGDVATEILITGESAGEATSLKYTLMEYGIGEQIKTWNEKGQGILGDAIASINLINTIMKIVALVVASVVIFIVTYINVINRKKQIAILKAIGVRKKIIEGSYLIQVLFQCACGAFVGILMLNVIVFALTVHKIRFPMGYLTPVLDYGAIATSILLLCLVSLVSAFIPARQVANEEILDAMRG